LIFKGINYRAAVWLNGEQIADSTEMAGMFAEYFLDVSDHIKVGKQFFSSQNLSFGLPGAS
jgi:hypothetical protein